MTSDSDQDDIVTLKSACNKAPVGPVQSTSPAGKSVLPTSDPKKKNFGGVRFTSGPIQRAFGVGTISLTGSERTHPELVMPSIANAEEDASLIDDIRHGEQYSGFLHIESMDALTCWRLSWSQRILGIEMGIQRG